MPTEYQLAILFSLVMFLAYLVTPLNVTLDKNLSAILEALGAIIGFILGHGAFTRHGQPGADKDLQGDTPQ